MKLQLTLCLLMALSGCADESNEYDYNLFESEINEKCLSRWWTTLILPNDMQPIGMSLKSFLSIVEKVENNHADWDIYRVTKKLLKRFAFEEIIFKMLKSKRRSVMRPNYKNRWEIISKLLPEDEIDEEFPEQDLTEQEKCNMFFMMGHLVNNTYRENFDEPASQDDHKEDIEDSESRVKLAKFPREQGVININGHPSQAVAISKVLNAILAGQRDVEYRIGDIVTEVQNQAFPREMKIKPDIGVTIGDVVSLAAIYQEAGTWGSSFFGSDGKWNHTGCPTEFTLQGNNTSVTRALLRGAVDGLLISQAVRTLGKIVPSLKLSRVLRTYYSPKGLSMSRGLKDGVSHCRRQELTTHIGQSVIQESVLAYYYMHAWKEHSYIDKESAEKVSEAINHMNNALRSMDNDFDEDECPVKNEDECSDKIANDRPVCETPSNVFAVLDTTGDVDIRKQDYIIGELSNKINFGYGAGSLSAFFDSRNGHELARISYNDSKLACTSCKVTRINMKKLPAYENEVQVLLALNKTLQRFDYSTEELPGVPSKVLIMFHGDQVRETDLEMVKTAVQTLRQTHRDARLFVIGGNRTELSMLTQENDDVITHTDPEDVVKALQKKICYVPANFQLKDQETSNQYTGYVTPNHVQLWAYQPKYYAHCQNVKITFSVANNEGDLTVCEGRGTENPGVSSDGYFNHRVCEKTNPTNRELEFNFKKPCGQVKVGMEHVTTCPAINFAIVGKDDNKTERRLDCLDDNNANCLRMAQIKFKVAFENKECNTEGPIVEPTEEPIVEPDLNDVEYLVGPISKATLFCKDKLSELDSTGQPSAGGCKVMCMTGKQDKFINVPDGLICKGGKGKCLEGQCMVD